MGLIIQNQMAAQQCAVQMRGGGMTGAVVVLVTSRGGGETQQGGGSQWCSHSGVMAVITGHVRSRLLMASG